MNLVVEQPTKIIKIQEIKHEAVTLEQIYTDHSLDFYNINSDNFEFTQKKSENEYLKNGSLRDIIDLKRKLQESSKTNETVKPSVLSFKFFIETLKNDIRVKNYVIDNCSITTYFISLNDAISFYQLYFSLAKMTFLREFNFGISIGEFNNESTNNIQEEEVEDINDKPKKETNHVFELKPFSTQNDMNKNGDKSIMTKEDFYMRIEFFNRMKGLYTKSELKKMNISNKENEEVSEDSKLNEEDFKFDLILLNAKELAVGSTTNIVMQSKIKEMTEDQICELIKSFGEDISAICSTKYGAYTIQSLILACPTQKSQSLICKYFGDAGKYLFCHEIGNYSIQRILIFNEAYVYKCITSDLLNIVENKLGMKVLKRCMGIFKDNKEKLKIELKSLKDKVEPAIFEEIETFLS